MTSGESTGQEFVVTPALRNSPEWVQSCNEELRDVLFMIREQEMAHLPQTASDELLLQAQETAHKLLGQPITGTHEGTTYFLDSPDKPQNINPGYLRQLTYPPGFTWPDIRGVFSGIAQVSFGKKQRPVTVLAVDPADTSSHPDIVAHFEQDNWNSRNRMNQPVGLRIHHDMRMWFPIIELSANVGIDASYLLGGMRREIGFRRVLRQGVMPDIAKGIEE